MNEEEYILELKKKNKIIVNQDNIKDYIKVGNIINTMCLDTNIHYSRKIIEVADKTMKTIPNKGYDLERKDIKKQLNTGLVYNIDIYIAIIKDLVQGSYVFYIDED